MKKLIFRKQLKEIIPISESTRRRLEIQGKFPARKQISEGRVAWLYDEVLAWIESRENAEEGVA